MKETRNVNGVTMSDEGARKFRSRTKGNVNISILLLELDATRKVVTLPTSGQETPA